MKLRKILIGKKILLFPLTLLDTFPFGCGLGPAALVYVEPGRKPSLGSHPRPAESVILYIGLLKDIVRLMTWETPKSGINPVTQLTRERANLWLQSVDTCVCKITLQSQGGRVCQSFSQ